MNDSNGFLDERRHDHEFDVAATLKSAKETLGKSYFAVVREIFQLTRGIGKLEPQEYLFYRLYDDALSADQKAAFLGRQAMKELDVRFLKNAWTHIAADKLVLYALLTGLGLPVPRTFAVYHPFRGFGDVACPRTAEEHLAILRNSDRILLAVDTGTGQVVGFITALTDGSGQVVERFKYGDYGRVTIHAPDWTPRGSRPMAVPSWSSSRFTVFGWMCLRW